MMHPRVGITGDRLTDEELEDILQSIDLDVDYEGNIKYEGKGQRSWSGVVAVNVTLYQGCKL